MTNSKSIAGILGPILVVTNLSEAINSHIWVNVTPPQTYLAGALWFVAGLFILRTHNYWAVHWSVLITILGWFILLGGLSRMFFPEFVQQGSQNNQFVFAFQMILLAIGIILCYKAFSKSDDK